MKNVTQIATDICAELNKNGFGGFRFCDCHVEDDIKLEDVWDEIDQEGELNPQQYAAWRESCMAFITQPDFPYDDYTDDNKYIVRSFDIDRTGFYNDLKEKIQKAMGDDVDVKFREGCFEWECVRKTYVHPV